MSGDFPREKMFRIFADECMQELKKDGSMFISKLLNLTEIEE